MRILNVIASLAPSDGGPFKTCPELAEALVQLGHIVDIYTTDHKQPSPVPLEIPIEQRGVRTTYFPIGFASFWGFSYSLARALRRDIPKYDIVHIYSFYLFHGFIAGHYCRKYNIPYIVQPHGALDPFLRKRHRIRKWLANSIYENINLRHAGGILFNSEEERRLALPVTGTTRPLVVPLGLHVNHYQKLPPRGHFRSKYRQTEGKQMILFLSRINFKKGLDILINAFAYVQRNRKAVHLVIAGPDSEGYLLQVRRMCEEKRISEYVTLVGMLSEEDKQSALVDADVFALISYSENFGVTILEALACGTPVLISDHVNIWREIIESKSGCVTPCDPIQASSALESMLSRPEKLREMGKNGQRLISECYDWTSVAKRQEEAYVDVLSHQQPSGHSHSSMFHAKT